MKYFLIFIVIMFSFQSMGQEKRVLVHCQVGQADIDII